MQREVCPICQQKNIIEIYDFESLPLTTEYLAEPAESVTQASLAIYGCTTCRFVFVKDMLDPEVLYSDNYNITSAYAAQHSDKLVEILAENLPEKGSCIFEIGANDGNFLKKFAEHGYERCIGLEPSKNCVEANKDNKIKLLHGMFSLEQAEKVVAQYGKVDLIILRHVIEHLHDLDELLAGLSELCSSSGRVYIEYPESYSVFKYGKYMNYFEQHVNYFTPQSLCNLLKKSDFHLLKEMSFSYGGGATGMLFQKTKDAVVEPDVIPDLELTEITNTLQSNIIEIKELFTENSDKSFALYGSGFTGISLVNNLHLGERMLCVFDDNQKKVGKYLAGSNLEIKAGEQLKEIRPDFCLISPLNEKSFEENIIAKNHEYLDAGGAFVEFYPGDYQQPEAFLKIHRR